MEFDLNVGAELLDKIRDRAECVISDLLVGVGNTSANHLHSLIQVLSVGFFACLGNESDKVVASCSGSNSLRANTFSNDRLATSERGLFTKIGGKSSDRAGCGGDWIGGEVLVVLSLFEPLGLVLGHFHEHLDESGEQDSLGLGSLADGGGHLR